MIGMAERARQNDAVMRCDIRSAICSDVSGLRSLLSALEEIPEPAD